MGAPGRASLRRYVARFGFERLAKALSAEATEYVAVYGSLREGFALPDAPDVGSALVDHGNCRIPGELYDLGEYPGLCPGRDRSLASCSRSEISRYSASSTATNATKPLNPRIPYIFAEWCAFSSPRSMLGCTSTTALSRTSPVSNRATGRSIAAANRSNRDVSNLLKLLPIIEGSTASLT